MKFISRILRKLILKLFAKLYKKIDSNLLLSGKNLSNLNSKKVEIKDFSEVEFSVYSQWGEDGIINWLLDKLEDLPETFIEFGVENYIESNTRYLLHTRNWSGLVIDGDKSNIEDIKKSSAYWKYDLSAVEAFITKKNINTILQENNFKDEVGLLSIDIDGNDYWIWEAINSCNPDIVINLAAQAGVRYSLKNPLAYINSNIIGFTNLLEISRRNNIKHLIYASSSSVYGGNRIIPFKEKDPVDHPVSMYATSKRTNELLAHTYSHLYGLASTGLRFFTVYGPWGRPDMALFLFTKNIIEGKPIKVFNYGHMVRDFTYIDDIVESLFRLLKRPPKENLNIKNEDLNPSSSWAPHKIFNIGNSNPIELIKYIEAIEDALQIKAIKEYEPIQPGDVKTTSADINSLNNFINFKPNTPVTVGVKKFVDWYRSFYSV